MAPALAGLAGMLIFVPWRLGELSLSWIPGPIRKQGFQLFNR